MDTEFYTLNTRRTRVSGGPDLVSFVRTPAPDDQSPSGEVLDFELCRLRLERKAILEQAVTPGPVCFEPEDDDEMEADEWASSDPRACEPRTRTSLWTLLPDLILSAAILGVCIAGALALL